MRKVAGLLLTSALAWTAAPSRAEAPAAEATDAATDADSPASPAALPAAVDPAPATHPAARAGEAVAPSPATAEPAAPCLFYFFSPDWRPPDLGPLGSALETALASGGMRMTFQAFTRYEDFERYIIEKPPDFLLAPDWVRNPGHASFPHLSVVARPSRRGRTAYRKALMSRPGIDSIDALARASVATTRHATDNGAPSEVLAPFHLRNDSTRLVPVPKDVDALLALSFGQVDGALVTSEQYDQLARSNPTEAARLRVLGFSPEVPLPPVFATAGVDVALTDRLRERLLHLADDPDGARALALLGFDAFVAAPQPSSPKAKATGGASKPTAQKSAASRLAGRP